MFFIYRLINSPRKEQHYHNWLYFVYVYLKCFDEIGEFIQFIAALRCYHYFYRFVLILIIAEPLYS